MVKEVMIDGIKYVPATEEKKPYFIKIERQLEVYPHDLPNTMTYVDAEKEVSDIGDGWRIPTLDELHLMYRHQKDIGNFCTKDYSSDWYWSCTEDRDHPSHVLSVRFSGGDEDWFRKALNRLSCRPVRLVAVPSAVGD